MTNLISMNAPEVLMPLAEKWHKQGKSFYLGPENMFSYNDCALKFRGWALNRDFGSWYICTDDSLVPRRSQLSKAEIEEIARCLAKHTVQDVCSLAIGYVCNSKCIMCPYHGVDNEFMSNELKRQQIKVVDKDVILKRIDKVKEMGIKSLYMVSPGEILSNPYWYDYMQYAANLGFTQWIITNGIGVNNQVIEKLKTIPNLNAAQISLHAVSYETWAKISRIPSREAYNNAINAPLRLKKECKIGFVSVTFVVQEENKHELESFIKYWKNKVDCIRIIQKLKLDNSLFSNNEFNRVDVPRGLCSGFSASLVIRTDGIITPCCASEHFYTDKNIEEGKLPVLNIDTDSIEKIKNEYFDIAFNDEFTRYCTHCYSNTLLDLTEDVTVYGHKAIKSGITTSILSDKIYNDSNGGKRLLKVKLGKRIYQLTKHKVK